MGVYKDNHNGQGPDPENDPEKLEKDYEKLYMKIGRDFLHKDDFVLIMEEFLKEIRDSFPLFSITLDRKSIPLRSNTAAVTKALLYKEYLEEEKDGVEAFAPFDLAIIDEEDEEDE